MAQKAEPEWKRYFAKNKKKVEKMDVFIHGLHQKYSDETDCLSCGNCCRALGPRITDKDVERMAKALRIKTNNFIEQYLRIDEDGDMVFRSMPCPFLGDDNYCAIYESRPKACREYPHTDRKRFYQIYNLSIKNAYTCPIVFNVLEEVKKQ
nr:YkgJ family cysteine cluster protein [Paludibacter sp. 221]